VATAAAAAAATARKQADVLSTSFPLPRGAVLGEAICRHYPDPSTIVKGPGIGGCTQEDRTLMWTPGRELWGLNSLACFRASTKSAHDLGLCLAIRVHKCTYCAQAQDTLQGIASELGTDWLQLWGANVHLTAPFGLKQRQLILLGPDHSSSQPARIVGRNRSRVSRQSWEICPVYTT